jgi:hypothetical protein
MKESRKVSRITIDGVHIGLCDGTRTSTLGIPATCCVDMGTDSAYFDIGYNIRKGLEGKWANHMER